MEKYKEDFIHFMVRSDVLTFGDFTTKSGRKTPFFINTGNYDNGAQMAQLGQFYAQSIHAHLGTQFDSLFGPAYKGIPLAVTGAIALNEMFEHNVTFAFNRKEAKDHGEGGTIVGHKFQDGEKIVIIEDVVTAGTSVRESIPLLKNTAAVEITAVAVSVDRMERGQSEVTALTELEKEYGLKVFSIVNLDEIVECLYNKEVDGNVLIDDEMKNRIDDYRELYGVKH